MGGITVNEYRMELGLEEIGNRGDVFLRPLNVVEVPLSGPVPETAPASNDTAESDDTETPSEDEGEPVEGEGKAARTAPDYPARKKLEKKVHDEMAQYFQAQEKAVLKRV